MNKKRLFTSILLGGLMVLATTVPSFGMGHGHSAPGNTGGGPGGGRGSQSTMHTNSGPASSQSTIHGNSGSESSRSTGAAYGKDRLSQVMQAIQSAPGLMSNYAAAGLIMNKMGQTGIKVFAGGRKVDFSVYGAPPVIKDGRTLIPVRALTAAMGAQVSWDSSTQTVTVTTTNGTTIQMTIGSNQMLVNGQSVTLDVPPFITNGRSVVPLRAIAQAIGMNVNWLGGENVVVITGKGRGISVERSVYGGTSVERSVYDGISGT